MLIIKKVSHLIKDEICATEKYARCALEYKTEDPLLAETFYTLANEHLKHVDLLHEQVTRIIAAYRKEKGDPPDGMLAIYNYVHEEQIDEIQQVKILMSMYKS